MALATDKHSSSEHRCPVNSNYQPEVKMFNLYLFLNQHRTVRSFADHGTKGKL